MLTIGPVNVLRDQVFATDVTMDPWVIRESLFDRIVALHLVPEKYLKLTSCVCLIVKYLYERLVAHSALS